MKALEEIKKRIEGATPPGPGRCQLCGEMLHRGEEMFKYHGFIGKCTKPPLPINKPLPTDMPRLVAALEKAMTIEFLKEDMLDPEGTKILAEVGGITKQKVEFMIDLLTQRTNELIRNKMSEIDRILSLGDEETR